MFENKKLMIGEHFIYEGMEWICLDIIDGDYLAITAQVWQELPFDAGDRNNWKKSSLRRVLNNEFLEKLNKNHLVIQTSDLTADNGDKQYGTCEDYVTILSCDQYRKYRDLVPHYPEWMWTLTPWSCLPSYSYYVREVRKTGSIYYDLAACTTGVAPVCIFSAEHLKLCRQTHLVEIDKQVESIE